jgi:uncharacterized membrane protein YeaQ/YmgE (transglycosylase-associated protein family)
MVLTLEGVLVWLVVGAIAGWLAGQIVRGAGFGLVGNIVIGIIGAAVAGLVLPGILPFGSMSPFLAAIVYATIGAVIVIVILSLLRRAT